MKDEEVRQYLIDFVEKTLNRCLPFTRVYGKHFVRQRLEVNLDKVYIGLYSNSKGGEYKFYDKSITIYSSDEKETPLTKNDIENNWIIRQNILHEGIHAIFCRTKEECETFKIENGTGTQEGYKDGTELGRGLTEGLTEWIGEKAGYEALAYGHELNTVRMLELAIGEEDVMQLARGNIRGNIARLLQMTDEECVKTLSKVDKIYQSENKVRAIKEIIEVLKKRENDVITEEKQAELAKELGEYYSVYLDMKGYYSNRDDVKSQLSNFGIVLEEWERFLDRDIANFETEIFEKYFKKEIENAQNAKKLSTKTMKRLTELYSVIQGGNTIYPGSRELYFALQFKDYIYEELEAKYRPTIWERLTGNTFFLQEQTSLPAVQNNEWFQTIWRTIKNKFIKGLAMNTAQKEIISTENESTKKLKFKQYVSDMSNYSSEQKQSIPQKEKDENVKDKDAQEL